MASKRCIPTSIYKSPDIFELSSDSIRWFLIKLISFADDSGRGPAHPRILAQELWEELPLVNQAMDEFEAHGIIGRYEVNGRLFFHLRHWKKYQVLSKPTPSQCPVPPWEEEAPQVLPALPEIPLGNPGESRPEVEDEVEGEGGRGRKKESPTLQSPTVVVVAQTPPPLHSDDDGESVVVQKKSFSDEEILPLIERLTSLLGVTLSLCRIRKALNEYGFSFDAIETEAENALDWAKRKKKPVSAHFFDNWLKREYEARLAGKQKHQQASKEKPLSTLSMSEEVAHANMVFWQGEWRTYEDANDLGWNGGFEAYIQHTYTEPLRKRSLV